MSKRKKGNTSGEVQVFLETLEEYRAHFFEILELRKTDWRTILKGVRIKDEHNLSNLSTGQRIEILITNESEQLLWNFENTIMDRLDCDPLFSKRMANFSSLYLGQTNERETLSRKRVLFFIQKFFSSNTLKTSEFELQLRRREEEFVMTQFASEITHIKLLDILIPFDIINIFMTYLPHDYSLICGLGCVNEKWFRVVLQTWKHIKITKTNYLQIPKLVLRNVESISFSREIDTLIQLREENGSEPVYNLRTIRKDSFRTKLKLLDLQYCFNEVSSQKVTQLLFDHFLVSSNELGDYYSPIYDHHTNKNNNNKMILSFPNLKNLGLPMRTFNVSEEFLQRYHISDRIDFEKSNLGRIPSLTCDLIDLHKLKNMYNHLRYITLFVQYFPKTYESLISIQETNKLKNNNEVCLFPNLEKIEILFFIHLTDGMITILLEESTAIDTSVSSLIVPKLFSFLLSTSPNLNCLKLSKANHRKSFNFLNTQGIEIHIPELNLSHCKKLKSLVLEEGLTFPKNDKKLKFPIGQDLQHILIEKQIVLKGWSIIDLDGIIQSFLDPFEDKNFNSISLDTLEICLKIKDVLIIHNNGSMFRDSDGLVIKNCGPQLNEFIVAFWRYLRSHRFSKLKNVMEINFFLNQEEQLPGFVIEYIKHTSTINDGLSNLGIVIKINSNHIFPTNKVELNIRDFFSTNYRPPEDEFERLDDDGRMILRDQFWDVGCEYKLSILDGLITQFLLDVENQKAFEKVRWGVRSDRDEINKLCSRYPNLTSEFVKMGSLLDRNGVFVFLGIFGVMKRCSSSHNKVE